MAVATIEQLDERNRYWIIAAAVAPFALALMPWKVGTGVILTVDLLSWAVFFVDLLLHIRLERRYPLTGRGIFDVAIVVFTFPWYVIPAAGTTTFMAVFRVARLVRLITAHGRGEHLAYIQRRLGGASIFVGIASLVSALIVLNVEPESSGYENLGDALWWAMVSFTTVGYGDLYPVTPLGRLAGLLMMVVGLAAIGAVAGVLATVLGVEDEETSDEEASDEEASAEEAVDELRELAEQVSALTEQVTELNRRLGAE